MTPSRVSFIADRLSVLKKQRYAMKKDVQTVECPECHAICIKMIWVRIIPRSLVVALACNRCGYWEETEGL